MLMRLSPFDEMELLKKQINSVFEPAKTNGNGRSLRFSPPMEVTEQANTYRIRVMVPGMDPSQLQLDANAKQLNLSGENSPREIDQEETVHFSEFAYGKFTRTLSFPEEIDPEQITAKYVQGVLEIRVPKAAAAQRKQIPIQVEPA